MERLGVGEDVFLFLDLFDLDDVGDLLAFPVVLDVFADFAALPIIADEYCSS